MAHSFAYCCSLLLACLLGFASLPGVATAQSGRRAAALNWVRLPGAEDCSGGDALSRAVEGKLRREVFPAPRNASVLIEGYVQRVAGGYRAALQMRSSDGSLIGSRELSSQAADCDELSETIAVVLAVMIDPDAAQAKGKPPPEPPPAQGRADAARPPQVVMAFARIALGLAEEIGRLPGGGLAYERGLGWGGLRVEGVFLSNRTDGEFTFPGEDATPRPAQLTLAYVGVGYCPLWLSAGRLRSSACVSTELGGIHARDRRAKPEETQPPSTWLAGSLQARLALRVFGPVEAHLAGAFSVRIIQYDFAGAQIDRVYGSLDAGLGVRF